MRLSASNKHVFSDLPLVQLILEGAPIMTNKELSKLESKKRMLEIIEERG